MKKHDEFDYEKYTLAASIYHYAERLVIYPNDQPNIEACKNQALEALRTCREKKIDWLPTHKPNKAPGNHLKGKFSVLVVMNSATSFGFRHTDPNATAISEYLQTMWKRFIHGDDLEMVLNVKEQNND